MGIDHRSGSLNWQNAVPSSICSNYATSMNEENYSLDVVSAFLAHLQMPLTSPHRSKLNVGAMVVLTGIPRIVETCPHSKVKATAQLLASRSRGIADFMSFLAVATDRSAMLDWTPELPNGQNGHLAVLLHNCAKTLVDLIKFDETVADAIVKQDSAHQSRSRLVVGDMRWRDYAVPVHRQDLSSPGR
ncbi:hypothetical protein FA13DRAFT_778854 [Coprinellus micaceus]|uniref:Uncharacterized protein n=1 Tax=Coprinellus micaceus TaxID=71717 RepID=A0A4Y7T3J1_COPMI|nr:hypothetical protein FA13DRAFT_778854 [Coprinellus micaceus]